MLKRRNLIVLIAVLAVLILISLVQQQSHRRATSQSSTEVLLPGTFAKDDLGRIEVGYGKDSGALVLTHADSGWQVTTSYGAKANQQRLDTLLGSLSDLRGEFRSDSAAVLPDYGFTDTSAVTIKGFDKSGQQVFAIEVGQKPKEGMGNFVRLPGSSKVYVTTAGLLGNLGLYSGPGKPQGRQFLDLQAITCDRKDVDAIDIQDGKQRMHLQKTFEVVQPAPNDTTGAKPFTDRANWEWTLTPRAKEAPAKTKVDAILGALCNLRAQDVADPAQALSTYGLADATRTATLTKQDSTTVSVSFGATRAADGNTPGGTYAQVSGDPTVWVIAEYQVNSIFKKPEDLLPSK